MKRILIIASMLLALTGSIHAVDNLAVAALEVGAGDHADLVISLRNSTSYLTAYQMVVTLPDGLSLQKDENGRYVYTLSTRHKSSHDLSIFPQDDGSYLLICYSDDNSSIGTASSATKLLSLGVTATVDMKSEKGKVLQGSVKDIVFSNNKGVKTNLEDVSFDISVVYPIIVIDNKTRKYGDADPTFTYTVEGVTGGKSGLHGEPVLSTEAAATSPIGTYAITASAGTIYAYYEVVDGTMTVTKSPLTITADNQTVSQGEATPELTLTYTGFKNDETDSVLTSKPVVLTNRLPSSNPGTTWDITVSGAEAQNYDITYQKGTLTVVAADPVVIKAKNLTREYGEKNPAFEWTSEGKEVDGKPSVTCSANIRSNVGTYEIVISKGSVLNYNDSYVNGTLTITRAPLTIGGGTYVKKQGEPMPTFAAEYTGFKNGEIADVLAQQPGLFCDANADSEPGEYPVIVSGAEALNYDITYVTGTLTVIEADPVVVTANNVTRKYGDENPVFSYTAEGKALAGTPSMTCAATKASPVGDYPIVITRGSVTNYNDSYVNGTLTVTKAPLTITVSSVSKREGEAMPEFTISYSGFKNGETETVLTKMPTITCEATVASPEGIYAITASGAEAQNYEIIYVAGTLTINEADRVIITANSYTREDGADNPHFDYSSEGSALKGMPTIVCDATNTSPVGTYPIVISKGTVSNAEVTCVNGSLTVTKAPLTIAVKSVGKKQGEAMPELEVTYSGFKNGETKAVLTKLPTISCEATADSPNGNYPITVGGAEAQNYEITYVNGALTVIDADAIVLTANSYTREYGDKNPAFEYTSFGAELEGTPSITCEATTESPVGEYPIVITKGGVTNYNDSYVNGTLTITKAPLKVTVKDCSRYIREQNPTFELVYTGFKNGETEAVLSQKPVVTCEATVESLVGIYTITVSGGAADNYELSYESGSLTVEVPPNDVFVVDNMTFQVSEQTTEKGVAFVRGPETEEFAVPASVNYSGLTYSVTALADGAFANLKSLKCVTIPSSVQALGKDVFANSPHLAAIFWEAPVKMTKEMAGSLADNPNLLFFTTDPSKAWDGLVNIVNPQTKRAERIVLADTEEKNDFYCPIEFTADEISYTHEYKLFTEAGKCQGWESLSLPFDVKEITHETKGIITPFGALQRGREYENDTRPFWLYEYTTNGSFSEAESIEANTPYIISMPNEA